MCQYYNCGLLSLLSIHNGNVKCHMLSLFSICFLKTSTIRTCKHSHPVFTKNSILPSQNSLYHLYYIILKHTQHINFYFPILLIKIIYLPNKIIYSKTISILSHLSPLSNFYLASTETKPPPSFKKT